MHVFRNIDQLAGLTKPLHLAIGVFDGLHLGHQAVIGKAVDGARSTNGGAVLVSFEPHPRAVFNPAEPPLVLTNPDHKVRLAANLGVEAVLLIPFDESFAAKSGREFIETLANAAPDLREICVGADWKFGCDRSGNIALLEQLGSELGFTAHGVETVLINGEKISSTAIRNSIAAGAFDDAAKFLGRDYSVLGKVVKGDQRGRQLGFPTANLTVAHEQLPPGGVYAIRAQLQDRKLGGVANLGVRPTVAEPGAQRLLEIHLFDYKGPEFYGENLEIWFEKFLRDEVKFDSLDALVAQIERDAAQARECL